MHAQQHMRLTQTQTTTLSPQLRQTMHILQLSAADLVDYVLEQSIDNPVMDITLKHDMYNQRKRKQRKSSSSMGTDTDIFDLVESPKDSLEMSLLSQIRMSSDRNEITEIAEFLAGNLNDAGYLALTIDEAAMYMQATTHKVEQSLSFLQRLDPAGIGARNLSECLQLQIERELSPPRWAKEIVVSYLDELASGQTKKIAKRLGAKLHDIECAIEYIRTLNPKPGISFSRSEKKYIVPDAIISYDSNKLSIVLNELHIPKVSINEYYEQLQHKSNSKETKMYIHSHLQSAKWIIRSIEQRKNTLTRVLQAITSEQAMFFEKGVAGLKPMVLQTIADKIGLHQSSISRAVHNKYVETPQGLFELKFFFSNGLSLGDGQLSSSTTSIKAMIKTFIEKENREKPLSDQKITDLLTEAGIQISRRTVMKYREEMNVLPSRFRYNAKSLKELL
jgi:RNA polymerase sigma-54 factor